MNFANPALYCSCGRMVDNSTAYYTDHSLMLHGICGCGLTVVRWRDPLTSYANPRQESPPSEPGHLGGVETPASAPHFWGF